MGESFAATAAETIELRGNGVPRSAPDCTGIHVRAARGIWPRKTAEHWAAAAGVKPRIVKYWLSGTQKVSEKGRLALIRLLD